ncbi:MULTISPECIES: LysR family transcriptional regulator [unclassified Streptomyces]|uniref:LysR substrate-binding domain-containing protein n=1 Tax=unclassified Streptomyces TaxID=2593676 RepID=UPI0022B736F4|nr:MULTISPECIES: LysR family transcriptional regulator [unclassified Streptomyces]MCZ7416603.1 LysR family transcriptional regulator [Streptomyces sp. WMMC897]MCZ7433585.1 LysR family transcriptional regulator [Streptomyces sp. WMMC1477]
MELEVRHLRALCAIADAGSVRAAARRLSMTQPSLTTQLRRIEKALGGRLFVRERTGSRPTPLGRTVLSRARPIVTEMAALINEAREAVLRSDGARLRIGSTGGTGSSTVVGWLRRLHERYPDVDTTIHFEVSANLLLRMVASGQLDAAFVHEVGGSPLSLPSDLRQRVLIEREPQFVAVPDSHPAARRRELTLEDLAGDRWMVDPSADGEWDGLRRVFAAAGVNPKVVLGDYATAWVLTAAGEVVMPCQPTSPERSGLVVRPLTGDPLTVRLLLVSRPAATAGTDLDAVFDDLRAAYLEIARQCAVYHRWLCRNADPALLRTEQGADV